VSSPRRVVIVGYGMAGARLAEEIRRRDPAGDLVSVTVLGAERHHAYNRVLLSAVVGGSLSPDAVRLPEAANVDLRLGTTVCSIDRAARRVTTADGSQRGSGGCPPAGGVGGVPPQNVDYDVLVLATGSRAWVPPTEGLLTEDGALVPGVVAFRTLDDCERILASARPGSPVAVLGGGLLGLEAARGLAHRGCLVTVVHPVGHLMERQLDPAGGRVLAKTLAGLGIEVRLNVLAARHLPGDGLKLDDGSLVPAELVVVSAGVKPETGLAEAAGLTLDRGIVVDDCLRTSDPRVHAIGDCAAHPGTVSGLVQPAWEQAAVLADLVTGTDPAARYRGTPVVTRLKARDVDLAALGDVHAEVDSVDAEVLCLQDPARGRYAKLVLRDGRVAGAILLGAPDAAATITQLYDRGVPAPSDRLGLLLGRVLPPGAPTATGPADLPAAAVICRCNTVSKGQLVKAWRAGARELTELAATTRATTGCGSCRDAVCGIADWLSAAEPA
jgi:assimilatory nitrate reductase electron transfer subunit